MYQVLFVDDDENLLKINQIYFEQHGYHVSIASTQEQALDIIQTKSFDCIVLDIVLPSSADGYQICEKLKSSVRTPIIFLTSLTEQDFLYRGFSSGCDDYITKPYDLKELEMRVTARINQSHRQPLNGEILLFPPLCINLTEQQVTINNIPVNLTSNEFHLLLLLARSPGHAFTPEEIYCEVWKMPDLSSTHTVQVHVARMRRKLENTFPDHKFISTAWGRGYLFSPMKEKKQPQD